MAQQMIGYAIGMGFYGLVIFGAARFIRWMEHRKDRQ